MPKKKFIDPEKEFPKVERMLYRAAWNASNKRFPIEEAITEAYWAYMEACRTYEFDKGMKFSSYLFMRVNNHLKTHIIKRIKAEQKVCCMEINDDLLGASPLRRSLEDALEESGAFSRDEAEILKLILDPPKGFSTLVFDWEDCREATTAELVKRLKEHLGYERGLDETYVDITLFHLKAKLEERKLAFT